MRIVTRTLALLLMLLPLPAMAASKAEVERQFQQWITGDLAPEAERNGISEQTLRNAFQGLSLKWDLPDLVPPGSAPPKQQDQSQAEFSSPRAYFSEKRLQGLAATGRSLAGQYADTLRRVEATYGVPGRIIVAIWGRESGFGRAKLPHSAI
ncbi:MAG TPA: lytic murein transglycosylase, partial [Pseudorhizobium sp.]|nr:lytic murein transglycosylase [Pseudorhizobium sp.]